MNVEEIHKYLETTKLSYSSEEELQDQIATALRIKGISFKREHSFSKTDRVDFFIEPNIALECKIQGQPLAILSQVKRYLAYDDVAHLILVTSRHMRLPEEIGGKKTLIVKPGLAWL